MHLNINDLHECVSWAMNMWGHMLKAERVSPTKMPGTNMSVHYKISYQEPVPGDPTVWAGVVDESGSVHFVAYPAGLSLKYQQLDGTFAERMPVPPTNSSVGLGVQLDVFSLEPGSGHSSFFAVREELQLEPGGDKCTCLHASCGLMTSVPMMKAMLRTLMAVKDNVEDEGRMTPPKLTDDLFEPYHDSSDEADA